MALNARHLRVYGPRVFACAVAAAFAASVLPSVPALRQDWSPYPFGVGSENLFWIGTSGWDSTGIGAPMPYPQAYLIAPLLALLRLALSAETVLVIFMLLTGALCAFGGRALAKSLGSGELAASAAALFLTFNPWTFTELVAGHTYMLLAYAATIRLIAEALRTPPRGIVLTLCWLAAFQQIQFALIDTAIVLAVAWRSRLATPALLAALVWLPSAAGVAMEHHALSSIPFTAAWEENQSVTPLGAIALNGYFARYGNQFIGTHCWPVSAIALLAVCGFAVTPRGRRVAIAVALPALAALIVAMGLRGPLAAPFSWSIAHLQAIGVFRELYDLLGYTTIGYAAGALMLHHRVFSWTFLASATALAVLWWVPPPSRWWVESSQLPQLSLTAPANTRFALLPAFQPMSLGTRGSGADPDLYARYGDVTPLNQYLATYPADTALAAFLKNDDTRALRALSVSRLFERSHLHSDAAALADEWALSPGGVGPIPRPGTTIALNALPELSLIASPAIGSLDNVVGAGNVFFGDAHEGELLSVTATPQYVDARSGWVDARLAFAQLPELAQGLGGALTSNPRALLPVRGGLDALVWVRGTLRSRGGRVLSHATRGYAWIVIPRSVDALVCSGMCVVAAQGSPPGVPENPPARPYRSVDFSALAPWLIRANVPVGPSGALRYNVAYDDGWVAYERGVPLKHLRLDLAVNGWLLPQRAATAPLLIVQRTAAAQAVAELLVACALVLLGARNAKFAWRRP